MIAVDEPFYRFRVGFVFSRSDNGKEDGRSTVNVLFVVRLLVALLVERKRRRNRRNSHDGICNHKQSYTKPQQR